jgi:hypothetical protein
MNALKIETRKQIDLGDWDNLVSEHYGKIYSFQQQDDCKERGIETITVPCEPEDYENDSIPFVINGDEMGVSFKTWLETSPEDTKKEFTDSWGNNLFWDRNFYPHVSMIINDLHAKGILPEGEYDIKINW